MNNIFLQGRFFSCCKDWNLSKLPNVLGLEKVGCLRFYVKYPEVCIFSWAHPADPKGFSRISSCMSIRGMRKSTNAVYFNISITKRRLHSTTELLDQKSTRQKMTETSCTTKWAFQIPAGYVLRWKWSIWFDILRWYSLSLP